MGEAEHSADAELVGPTPPPPPPRQPACDLCGHPMRESHCKLVCDQCGYIRDCSDP